MRLLFKGGTVVTGKGPRRADILVEGEKILDVCRDIPAIGAQVVDVTGMLLFPGFIDAHTHFDLDVCNTTTADDFASGSRAALRGGTTTIIDFACPNKGETLHDGLRLWHEKADGKCCLRLRLPHDHRRLERDHRARDRRYVRRGYLLLQDVHDLPCHDDR